MMSHFRHAGLLFFFCIVAAVMLGIGPTGFERYSSLHFWSLAGGAMVSGLFFGVFIGIMSAGGSQVKNPRATAIGNGLAIFFVFALVGILAGYLLNVPANPFLRFAIGAAGIPIGGVLFIDSVTSVIAKIFKR